ncbi:unnamed protein product [Bursaphelenchus xylophilus]|uniref:(pine wood nematode) hypothetical protein n=1 Tax=Bursaphelenchus xylophilus TaxID=6326 RepID=A0A1I7RT92_BURXY|nr:unnamed protein product [Bursaphelenchus xylophilus]CAG9122532.1 unnamed protein product [Bursaphelenchus xylophilus]
MSSAFSDQPYYTSISKSLPPKTFPWPRDVLKPMERIKSERFERITEWRTPMRTRPGHLNVREVSRSISSDPPTKTTFTSPTYTEPSYHTSPNERLIPILHNGGSPNTSDDISTEQEIASKSNRIRHFYDYPSEFDGILNRNELKLAHRGRTDGNVEVTNVRLPSFPPQSHRESYSLSESKPRKEFRTTSEQIRRYPWDPEVRYLEKTSEMSTDNPIDRNISNHHLIIPQPPSVAPPLPPKSRKMSSQSEISLIPSRDLKSSNFEQIHNLLKTEDVVIPMVERFLRSQFVDGSPQKTLDISDFSHSDTPLKHSWERIFRVSDGKKAATIKLENRLTIEKEESMGDSEVRSHRKVSSSDSSSGFRSSDSPDGFSEKNSNSDSDLLLVVHKKIAKGIPLEWPELFLLKNSHCRHVMPLERLYRQLSVKADSERKWRQVGAELRHSYTLYQDVLERCLVVDELYTQLAYMIMQAESYWYGARICADRSLQTSWYRLAVQIYARLLQKAQLHLPASDRSLLTVMDKLSQIMLESADADERTLKLCKAGVVAAEKELELNEDIKRERKLIKIKNRLVRVEAQALRN